jgi:hypothetical protein
MQKSPGIPSGFAPVRSSRGIWIAAALIVFSVASVIAWTQAPRPLPMEPGVLAWLKYPIELNAADRLPIVRGTLFSVAISSSGQRVVAVGENGTIVTSNDGGHSWEAQTSGSKLTLFGISSFGRWPERDCSGGERNDSHQ